MLKIQYFILFTIIIISFQANPRNLKENDPLSLKEEEKSDDIIILHTNDVHCGINDTIGYDGLMLYKKELQRNYKNVILVDGGDHIQGNIVGLLSKGLDIIEIMNKVGYDIAVLGNHEFDYGVDALNECSNKLKCGYISANFCYRKTKLPVYDAYKIIEAGDKKIGFLGVTTPLTLVKSCLHSITDENKNMVYDFLSGNEGQEFYNTVQNYINDLKNNKKVDYIILIDHIGDGSETISKYSSSELLSNITGINAMIDGHTHKVYSKTGKDKEGNNVILAQTGTKLTNIGLIKIKTDGKITSEMISKVPEPKVKEGAKKIKRTGGKEVWVDTEIYELIKNMTNKFSDELDEKIGFCAFSFKINTSKDKDHHKHTCRSEECPLGNLITDSMLSFGNVQIAFKNAGAIRTDLFKGDITYKDILDVLPFSNEIVVKTVLGKDILDALELSMSYLPNKSPRFVQVSGISFKVNATKKSTVKLDENEMFVEVMGERRVYDVKVGNEYLDLNKEYNISLDEYSADGGDGFSMFGKYEDDYPTGKSEDELLLKYIKEDLNGIIPDKYKTKEERIIIYLKNKSDLFLVLFISISLTISFIVLMLFIIYLLKNTINYTELTNERVEGSLTP